MALNGPILDDRSFDELRDELVKRIPVYTPTWTDHNASDPGIALLELFAWLGESVIFRFNQIPDATRIAFLSLLGVSPRPAQVARTLLALSTDRLEGVQVLKGRTAPAGSVPFETDDEVYAWPLDVHAVGKVKAPDLPADAALRSAEQHRRDDAVARLLGMQPSAAQQQTAQQQAGKQPPRVFYEVAAVPDLPGDDALDVATTLDQTLWVALLAKTEAAAQAFGATTALADGALFLGVAFDEVISPPVNLSQPNQVQTGLVSAASLTSDPLPVLWELWTPPARAGQPPVFVPLAMPRDTTRGLSTTGVVTLVVPHGFAPLVPPLETQGGRSEPPRLDDEKLIGRVIAWLRARRPTGSSDRIRRVRWVGINAVEASQARTATAELLGIGTGQPDQVYRLANRPVVPGTVRLEVEEPDGWRGWIEVDPATTSEPGDRHFTVDLLAGEVHFGTRSMVPQIGYRIRVTGYRYGGGEAGNVPAGAISALSGVAGVKVTNVLPAAGGADAASLTEALEEVPAAVHRRDRLVTAEDLQSLAEEVPGVCRAVALPLLHPDTPYVDAAGVMSVAVFPDLVVPGSDARPPEAPLPDRALLRRVAAYLDPRRLVTTELYVIPPTYRTVAVAVGVQVRQGYQVDAVRRWVELILRQYLGVLPPDGPDGRGWPLGRAVRRAELEAVAVQVEGVEYVQDELRLAFLDASGNWVPSPLVELRRWEAPEVGSLTVVAGSPLPVGEGYEPPPDPDQAELVPLPPEVC
jgi:predicted phage baseplate assembly protein